MLKQKHTAILYILLAALFFSGMTAFVHLSGDLPTGQKALFRNLPALFIAAFTLWRKGISPLSVAPVNRRPMFWRCLFGTTGLLCNFYAIDHLVLSDANMLNKLSPFFAVILSYVILKEKVRPVQAAGLAAAFAGALLIIKPSFYHVDYVPALIGALGGLGAGAAYTFVRKMGLQGEEGARIVFYFSLFSWCRHAADVPAGRRGHGALAVFLPAGGGAVRRGRTVFHYQSLLLCPGPGNFRVRLYAGAFCCSVGLCPFRTAARCAECGGLCCHHRRSGLDVSLQPPPGSRWAGCAAGAFLRRI